KWLIVFELFWRKTGEHFFTAVKQGDHKASEKEHNRGIPFHKHGEKADRMMRNIAYAILIQIVSFIFVPIVAIKCVGYSTAVCSNVERILHKIIFCECVVHTAGHDLDRPSVVFKAVFKYLYPIAAFHKYSCGILNEDIVLDMAVRNVFE